MRSTRSTDSASTGRRGFTLIELMVVLVIMAGLSSLVVPSIASALRRTGLGSTGTELCDLLDFAYMTAVTRHRAVDVNLSEDKGRCWVTVRSATLPWIEEQERPKAQRMAVLRIPEGTRMTLMQEDGRGMRSAGRWEILTFNSDGTTDDAVVVLSNDKGEEYRIEIFGATGEVHGKEGSE